MSFSDRLRWLLKTAQAEARKAKRGGAGKAREYFRHDAAPDLDLSDSTPKPAPPPPPVEVSRVRHGELVGGVDESPPPAASPKTLSSALRAQLREPHSVALAVIWSEILDRPVSLRPNRGRRVR